MTQIRQSFAGLVHDQELADYGETHYQRLLKQKHGASPEAHDASSGSEDDRLDRAMKARGLEIKDNLVANQEPAITNLAVPMKEMLPGHKRDQAGIALRAWGLGQILGVSILLAGYATCLGLRLWRPPFFLACLALFHYLEFWTHARFNLPNATVSAYLLFDNGWPYLVAHLSAMIETSVTSVYCPEWQDRFYYPLLQQAGFALVIVGQLVRSMAIAKAGTNFNHQVQHKKKSSHELVTDGIYGILRHPSYFGFFWWAIGTQIALGNIFCTCIYAIVLWRFFNRRIHVEEKHLIMFFGQDYTFYRSYSRIGIPFIRSRNYPEVVDTQAAEKKVE